MEKKQKRESACQLFEDFFAADLLCLIEPNQVLADMLDAVGDLDHQDREATAWSFDLLYLWFVFNHVRPDLIPGQPELVERINRIVEAAREDLLRMALVEFAPRKFAEDLLFRAEHVEQIMKAECLCHLHSPTLALADMLREAEKQIIIARLVRLYLPDYYAGSNVGVEVIELREKVAEAARRNFFSGAAFWAASMLYICMRNEHTRELCSLWSSTILNLKL